MDSRKYFTIGAAIIAMLWGSYLTWRILTPPPQVQTATVLPVAAELAEFSLLDQHGNTFTRGNFAGHWNLVFFGFTHCPDICPLTLQVLASARQSLADSAAAALPRIVLVSVDPERDTPELIGQYVSHFGTGIVGVTGELAEVRKLTEGLGIYFEKSNVGDDNYSVDHSAVVVVIDPDGRFRALFSAPHLAEHFVHDLPIIMSGR